MPYKQCVDHLGNRFKSKSDMCRHWGTNVDTFNLRIQHGWTLEKALTYKNKKEEQCRDHNGRVFNNIGDMCKHWGVNIQTFRSRIKSGWSIEDALTGRYVVYDHTNQKFKNFTAMCRHWGITKSAAMNRLGLGWSLEKALTTPVSEKGIKCTDHTGKIFETKRDMCKHWGTSESVFNGRIKKGYTLEEALTGEHRDFKTEDHLGNKFENEKEMCTHWGIDVSTFRYRIRSGRSLREALETGRMITKRTFVILGKTYIGMDSVSKQFNIDHNTLEGRIHSRLDMDIMGIIPSQTGNKLAPSFIGLDGKAYYKMTWDKKYVTARDIIQHYRPDLLSKYDEANPTGEYRPYTETQGE